jgi:hypothetical protein
MILRMVCRAFAANGGFLMECCWPRYAGVLSAGERSTPTAAKEYRALSDTLGSPTAISTSLSNCSWVVLGLGLRALLTEGLILLQKQTARAAGLDNWMARSDSQQHRVKTLPANASDRGG